MSPRQGAVSRLETRDDWKISSLRDYLSALGATLKLSAVFDDGGEVRVSLLAGSVAAAVAARVTETDRVIKQAKVHCRKKVW